MTVQSYPVTVSTYDGFGFSQVDVGSTGVLVDVFVFKADGSLPSGGVVQALDGPFEPDGLYPAGRAEVIYHNPFGSGTYPLYYGLSCSGSIITVVVKTKDKGVGGLSGMVVMDT